MLKGICLYINQELSSYDKSLHQSSDCGNRIFVSSDSVSSALDINNRFNVVPWFQFVRVKRNHLLTINQIMGSRHQLHSSGRPEEWLPTLQGIISASDNPQMHNLYTGYGQSIQCSSTGVWYSVAPLSRSFVYIIKVNDLMRNLVLQVSF